MKQIMRVAVTLTAGLAAVLAGVAPAHTIEPLELRPAALERGADIRLPHLEGRTVVDGDVRVRVRGERVTLLGRSGKGYVVGVTRADGSGGVVKRVRPGAPARVLLRRVSPYVLTLSGDGQHLARVSGNTPERTRITVYRASNGTVLRGRTFAGSASVLDVEEGRMVIGSWGPNRTLWWDFASNTTAKVVARTGSAADIAGNRLATYTGDPYEGGCVIVSRLDTPRVAGWRSCSERVAAFSPDGGRMATIHILSDGLGPDEVRVRTASGQVVGRYTAHWFGALVFENERALLLDTNGEKWAATVRCVAARCVRASALRPVPTF
ncbi:MAG: hypothetical protein Q7J48_06480 [Nocardioides sp.]|nr:hypothetical protein [Nocardioides sp.]